MRPHHNRKKLRMVACTCHPSYKTKCKIGRLQSRLAWAKSDILSPKITRAKEGWRLSLYESHKALSSNPYTAKNK
jgi:hypothetical protein